MLTISETFNDYAARLADVFEASSLRVELDNSNEKIGYKIRENTLQKVPFMVIIGANEIESNQVNLRLNSGEQISFDDVESAVDYLRDACRPPDVIDQQQSIQTSIQALKPA